MLHIATRCLRRNYYALAIGTFAIAGAGVQIKLNSKRLIIRASETASPLLDMHSLKLQVESDKELTWEKMSMKGAMTVSSSVSSLVEVIAARWIECETLYHKYLETLIDILSAIVKVIGTDKTDELWSTLMFVRGYLAEIKEERRQLHLLWSNCQSLAEHAGQAAFLTGADFSGCRLGELLPVITANMSHMNELTNDLELKLAKLEAEEIRKSTKHHERTTQHKHSTQNKKVTSVDIENKEVISLDIENKEVISLDIEKG